jgi:two-component system, cell cycle sensor histidine kinase and response regulator CckA
MFAFAGFRVKRPGRVLMNLCINARDAMPGGGRLSVSAAPVHLTEAEVMTLPFLMPGTHVVISVRDTGVGMEAETLHRAFEPFFTTEGGQGTGMGLATAYSIIKNHGGLCK